MQAGRKPNPPEDDYVFAHARDVLMRLMRENGTTQVQLGQVMGRSQRLVSDRVKGRSNMNLADVYKLAKHYKVPPAEFFPVGGSNEVSVSACTQGAYPLASDFEVAA